MRLSGGKPTGNKILFMNRLLLICSGNGSAKQAVQAVQATNTTKQQKVDYAHLLAIDFPRERRRG